jgi:hypothetical protein
MKKPQEETATARVLVRRNQVASTGHPRILVGVGASWPQAGHPHNVVSGDWFCFPPNR